MSNTLMRDAMIWELADCCDANFIVMFSDGQWFRTRRVRTVLPPVHVFVSYEDEREMMKAENLNGLREAIVLHLFKDQRPS